jgi:hypothetical protein
MNIFEFLYVVLPLSLINSTVHIKKPTMDGLLFNLFLATKIVIIIKILL